MIIATVRDNGRFMTPMREAAINSDGRVHRASPIDFRGRSITRKSGLR